MKLKNISIDEKNIKETGSTRSRSNKEIRSKARNTLIDNKNGMIY